MSCRKTPGEGCQKTRANQPVPAGQCVGETNGAGSGTVMTIVPSSFTVTTSFPPGRSTSIVSDVEVVPMQSVNEAYARLVKNDVRYRFVIDMASLK